MSSCTAAPKEKKFGVKVCRERKCKDLQRDSEYPDSPQMCAVTHGMPGAMSMCVKEMDDDQLIRQCPRKPAIPAKLLPKNKIPADTSVRASDVAPDIKKKWAPAKVTQKEKKKPRGTGKSDTKVEPVSRKMAPKEKKKKESAEPEKSTEKEAETTELKMIPEFRNLIPGLSSQEFRGLEESLQSEGCRDPIVTWKGIIVDGHNRYQICTALKIPFKTIEREFADETEVKIWIIKNQFSRRNLLPYVRATLAESLKGMIAEKAKVNQIRGGSEKGSTILSKAVDTRKELSKISGVSQGSIQKVEFINEKASDEVKQKLASGEVSINSAYKEIKNPGLFTSDTDEWYTPKEIIESVLKVFGGQIDVDPCSNSWEIPNVPAAVHFTKEDDGLTKSWFGKVYMNPPYGREIKDWILKLIEEKEKGNIEEAIALVPARTDTEWFAAFDPHPWCAVKGRLKFSDNPNSAPFPSAIFYLGNDEDLEGLERFFQEFNKQGIIYQTIQQQMEANDA